MHQEKNYRQTTLTFALYFNDLMFLLESQIWEIFGLSVFIAPVMFQNIAMVTTG